MEEKIGSRVSRAVAWSSIAEIMSKLISPIVNMVLARLLAPEAFGAVATITVIISFAELFTDAGFQKYIVQHEFSSKEDLDENTNVAFWTNLSISCLIVVGILIFRNPIASLVGSPTLGNGIAVSSSLIVLVAFSSIQTARFRRDLNFKPLFFVRIVSSIIPLVVTIPLALVFKNFWALVIGNVSVNAFNAVILTVFSKWKPKLYYSFSKFKKMFSFSVWTLLESLLVWLTAYADVFVVGMVLNSRYLGMYKTAMTTVNSYMAIVIAAVVPVLFSALSRYQNDEALFKSTFAKFQKYIAMLVLPMSAGIFIFREIVTAVLLGSQWMEIANFLGIWGLTSGISIVFTTLSSEVYRSKGNPRLATLVQILHLVFLIPTIMISIKYGFDVLCISRSLVRLQSVLTSIIIMHFVYRFRLSKTILNLLPIIISTLSMCAVGYGLLTINYEFWWQLVSIMICIVVYGTVLMAFPKMRKEILEIPFLKKVLRKREKDITT